MRQVCINKGTGALVFDITPVCAYSVLRENFLDEEESLECYIMQRLKPLSRNYIVK